MAQAIEDWMIDNKCNPKTPEEWNRCLADLAKSGDINYVGSVKEEDFPAVKKALKDDGAKEI